MWVIKFIKLIYKLLSEADTIFSIGKWGMWKRIGGYMTTAFTLLPSVLAYFEKLSISLFFAVSLATLVSSIVLFFFIIPHCFFWIGKKFNLFETDTNGRNKNLKNNFISKKGIKFDFTSYLGASKKEDNPIIVSCVQVSIENITNKHIAIDKAYIVSNINGKKIPIRIKTTNKGYVDFNKLNHGIPPNQKFYTQALFYKSGDQPEGIIYDRFLREFSDFSYIINIKGKDIIIKTVKPDEVKQLLKIHFPDPKPTPTLTAKEDEDISQKSTNDINNKIFSNILDTIAKYNQITADYVYNPHYPKTKTQENQDNLKKDFDILLALKEVMLDNKLECYLKDIRQRIFIIFNHAMSLEFDENELRKKRIHGAISNREYNQEMPELHNDFLKYKEIIINYLKQ